ncbi:head morphogenesis protein [Phyllobacterium endophyticum]|uniref:Head morphogenesis protein n=2 Tax=Phyllobacterium endophyticum TaxID=1149773 RepID=A0A2P7AX22_9HYPH|nr:head morphogenesis protein [Phyllobacterium endophyticum]TYR44522.1 head morphogenesis protein [Phyllobacterium endophyticum]
MASNRSIFEQLLDKYDTALAKAFFKGLDAIKSDVTLRIVVERLERGDIPGAVAAIQVEREAFSGLEMVLAEAYNAGGISLVENLPRLKDPEGNRVIFRFGVRDYASEAFLRDHSAELVTRIVEDQKVAIRQALETGLSEGRNPRSTALDVIGRINRASGKREGGILGLTSSQERFVASAREELLSGDPKLLRHYLSRQRRDKRFDKTIAKAIREEKPLTAETVTRMVGRYSDRLLELRGEMLARTETMIALGTSRDNAMRQQIDNGKVGASDVKKIWRSAGDGRVRHTHRVLNGKAVEIDGVFHSASGAVLRYPGDPQAPASEISGCRCHMEYKVDYLASVVRRAA